jgi:hypothetical protein
VILKSSTSRHSEVRLVLEPARAELVRAFVRESCLCEDVSLTVAGLIAEDTAQVWQALCGLGSGHERTRIQVLCSRKNVSSRVILPGHARFARVPACLVGHIRADAGVSWREHGIDEWEVCIHRGLTEQFEPPNTIAARELPSAAAVTGSPRDYTIDLPQRGDAPAIARCFLAVYGHTYVHPEVFAPHRYWDKVERGELIPVVARDGQGEVIGHLAL